MYALHQTALITPFCSTVNFFCNSFWLDPTLSQPEAALCLSITRAVFCSEFSKDIFVLKSIKRNKHALSELIRGSRNTFSTRKLALSTTYFSELDLITTKTLLKSRYSCVTSVVLCNQGGGRHTAQPRKIWPWAVREYANGLKISWLRKERHVMSLYCHCRIFSLSSL